MKIASTCGSVPFGQHSSSHAHTISMPTAGHMPSRSG